ncbi:MAG: biosynthetic-type acetolactate synthase large subunit [Thermodesulfobacteriota bacterium]
MKIPGAKMVVEALKKEGVEVVFGYPGGTIMPFFDCLHRDDIRMILTRHEQGAVHAADGYARASGKVGVCVSTSGPGATNLVTGIATANMDSVPIIAITGQVPVDMIGNDAFQEADIIGISRPITKHSYLVRNVEDIPRIMKEAFHIARTGRPGPVLIDLPKDVSVAVGDFNYPERVNIRGYNPILNGNSQAIKRAMDLVRGSKKPLIYAGGGVIISEASGELTAFARKTGIPVTLTLMGLGAFPGTDPLFLGMLGMHGTVPANQAVCECDLLIGIGTRFDDRVTGRLSKFATKAKIVHMDIDPGSIGKNVLVDAPVVGDAREILREMLKLAEPLPIDSWREELMALKRENPLTYRQDCPVLKPQYVVEKIYEVTGGDAIITTEVGQNQMWAAHYFRYDRPRTFLSSGGLGTMGYGFPAAIGAQVAFPDRVVFDVAGDGSIQMKIQELATAVLNELPVNIAILNNGYLGMVRQWQELFFDKAYAFSCLEQRPSCPRHCNNPDEGCPPYVPDFVKLAEAYGAVGIRVEHPEDVEEAIREAIDSPKTVILEFLVAREENVFPMVPAGAGINEIVLG